MSPPSNRLREHPKDRFHATWHRYDLDEVTRQLRAEPLPASRNHRQETIYKGSKTDDGPTTISLFVFDQGAHLPRHVAQGVVTVHVIEGHVRMVVEKNETHLKQGQLLVMAPGVEHDVHAEEASRMLLTVSLEKETRE